MVQVTLLLPILTNSSQMSTKFSMSFRITHPFLDPERISAGLGLRPKTSWKSGDERKIKSGPETARVYHSSYWSIPLEPGKFSDFRDVIRDFTHSRLKKIEPLLKEIRLTGGCSEFYLSWFVDQNAGVVFACDLLAELARLHIDLALDLYPFVPSAKGEIDASA